MPVTIEKTKHIDELHFEHQSWTRELRFYKDELNLFKKRLEEVSGMYTSKEVTGKLEHFQNQFILQNDVADVLLHDLKEHEQFLASGAREHSVTNRVFADHPKMRDRMDSFVKLFRDLRKEYMNFLSAVM